MPSPARVADLADRAELDDLVVAYAFAADRQDAARIASLFTSDGAVYVPASLGPAGRDPAGSGDSALVRVEPAGVPGTLARFVRTRHVVSQRRFTIDGDAARGETYGTAHHIYRRDDELRDRSIALRYADEFERTAEGWRFTRRELAVDWLADEPVRDAG